MGAARGGHGGRGQGMQGQGVQSKQRQNTPPAAAPGAQPQTGATGTDQSAPRMAGQYSHYQRWMDGHPAQEGQSQQDRDDGFLQYKERHLERNIQSTKQQLSAVPQSQPIMVEGQLQKDPIASGLQAKESEGMRTDLQQKLQRKRQRLDEIRKSKALYTPGAVSSQQQPSPSTPAPVNPAPTQPSVSQGMNNDVVYR